MAEITKVNRLLKKFFTDITVVKKLGEGGSGKVYSIYGDPDNVIKMIPYKNRKEYEILKKEIETQQELNELDIGPALIVDNIQILDSESKSKDPIFIIMEKIQPINSITDIQDDVEYQIDLIKEIAKMVYHGFLHNDLHVDNIAINVKTQKATVIDFGLTVQLPTPPDNKLLFDQLLLAQLYALIEPCNENNCPDKSQDWPNCGFEGNSLEKICDGPIVNQIYQIRNNKSKIWNLLNKSSSISK